MSKQRPKEDPRLQSGRAGRQAQRRPTSKRTFTISSGTVLSPRRGTKASFRPPKHSHVLQQTQRTQQRQACTAASLGPVGRTGLQGDANSDTRGTARRGQRAELLQAHSGLRRVLSPTLCLTNSSGFRYTLHLPDLLKQTSQGGKKKSCNEKSQRASQPGDFVDT